MMWKKILTAAIISLLTFFFLIGFIAYPNGLGTYKRNPGEVADHVVDGFRIIYN